MPTMFVRHTVADYKAWRKAYNAFQRGHNLKGLKAESVYQAADNPNDITVIHDFTTIKTAQDFIKSEELKSAMQSAGVVGAPTIWFTKKV